MAKPKFSAVVQRMRKPPSSKGGKIEALWPRAKPNMKGGKGRGK
jgi:hypothetical protein